LSREAASYRQILRSTSTVGGATLASLIVGLVKMKVFALLVGPVGLGLYGMFNSVLATASAVAGLGLTSSGVQQLAVSKQPSDEAAARSGIWSLTWPLAFLGFGVLWVLQRPLAVLLLGDESHAATVGWLGIGVALSVLAGSQLALLQGYRQIGNLAKVRIYSALAAAGAGVAAVYMLGEAGIVLALIATPLAGVVVGLVFLRHVPQKPAEPVSKARLALEWRMLLSLGFIMMVAGFIAAAAQTGARSLIFVQLGAQQAGLYQAAWMASVTNISIILAAMSADYFPRLSKVAGDRTATSDLLNQQIKIALLLGGPILLGLTSSAPAVLWLLYSAEFSGADALFQWHLAGDVLKLVSWSLGFVLVAAREMRRFVLIEASFAIAYILMIWLLLPLIGLDSVGLAYFLAYAIHVSLMAVGCVRLLAVRVSGANLVLGSAILLPLLCVILISRYSVTAGSILGWMATLVLLAYSGRSIAGLISANPSAPAPAALRFWKK